MTKYAQFVYTLYAFPAKFVKTFVQHISYRVVDKLEQLAIDKLTGVFGEVCGLLMVSPVTYILPKIFILCYLS